MGAVVDQDAAAADSWGRRSSATDISTREVNAFSKRMISPRIPEVDDALGANDVFDIAVLGRHGQPDARLDRRLEHRLRTRNVQAERLLAEHVDLAFQEMETDLGHG